MSFLIGCELVRLMHQRPYAFKSYLPFKIIFTWVTILNDNVTRIIELHFVRNKYLPCRTRFSLRQALINVEKNCLNLTTWHIVL
jgi:hypothetical protein